MEAAPGATASTPPSPLRQGLLSFIRPRGHSSAASTPPVLPPIALLVSGGSNSSRRRPNGSTGVENGVAHIQLRPSLSRRPLRNSPAPAPTTSTIPPPATGPSDPPKTYRIRLVPHLETTRSLRFDPILRAAVEGGPPIRVGRFTDRNPNNANANTASPNPNENNGTNSNKVAFKSKVVSRGHAEIWVVEGGKFFIKDTSSSSGTFLNHIRLSPPNIESLPFALKDGDIVQLGVDYQGGAEEMYRCVKMRVEVGNGRLWQANANAFNTSALKNVSANHSPKTATDCCICLFPLRIRQSLFVSSCGHTFHYKCVRTMLELHHPGFCCPLCRGFANLEQDVEEEELEDEGGYLGVDEPVINGNGLAESSSRETDADAEDADVDAVHQALTEGEEEDLDAAIRLVTDREGTHNSSVNIDDDEEEEEEDMVITIDPDIGTGDEELGIAGGSRGKGKQKANGNTDTQSTLYLRARNGTGDAGSSVGPAVRSPRAGGKRKR